MRTEWITGSAAMLVLGGFALACGFGILPLPQGQGLAEALRVAAESPRQWLASCALIFAAAICLTLGVVAVLALLRRDRRLAVAAVGLFTIGTIGMCGYATVLVFVRGLMLTGQPTPALNQILGDAGTVGFALAWQICFLLGLLLIAVGLFRSEDTPRWVPVLIVVFVVSQFVPLPGLYYYVTLAKWALLAVAFIGVARAASDYAHNRDVEQVLTGGRPHTV